MVIKNLASGPGPLLAASTGDRWHQVCASGTDPLGWLIKEEAAAVSAVGAAALYLHHPGDSHSGQVGFLGAQLPPEVAAMAQLLGELNRSMFRKLLKFVVSSLQGEDCREAVQCLGVSANLPEEWLGVLLAGMHTLLQQALHLRSTSLKPNTFRDQLQELCVPHDLVRDLASIVFGSQRPILYSVAQQPGAWLPHVADFQWWVDVTISTSALAHSLQLSVLMQLKLSDGLAYRFEVPIAKFQELWYSMALVLKEMADLEKKCECGLQD
ncbi:PREDICTED: LOW QUALITY PROTEIN: COMM domain-containing protein 5-like [Mandrillus leucophaeus]|uniref:LOW QUALITY PROTEIN: COMM domain-containing protein 5-like n=1 Tax=Mandrillus leucophaeus TaxID=9568 RepID=UPI0005F3962F|nr:PREDICTED: LOW QUALITY PROTEIN: COMM domain-containing protein 5-like [Mandrillus leucophaeus]